jgi:hypothetical protein
MIRANSKCYFAFENSSRKHYSVWFNQFPRVLFQIPLPCKTNAYDPRLVPHCFCGPFRESRLGARRAADVGLGWCWESISRHSLLSDERA